MITAARRAVACFGLGLPLLAATAQGAPGVSRRATPALAAPTPGGVAVCATFADSTFEAGSWSAGLVSQVLVCEEGSPHGSYAGLREAAGGNGDAWQRVTIDYSSSYAIGAHVRAGAVFDPATQGSVQSISFAYDTIYLETVDGSLTTFPILVQDDTWYAGPPATFCACQPGWQHREFPALTALQFTQLIGPGPRHPVFTPAGGSLAFGFGHLAGSSTCFDSGSFRSGVDNWRVEVLADCDVPVRSTTWGAIKARHAGR